MPLISSEPNRRHNFVGTIDDYAKRYAEGSNVVVLDRDVAKRFKTAEEVNEALRALIDRDKQSARCRC